MGSHQLSPSYPQSNHSKLSLMILIIVEEKVLGLGLVLVEIIIEVQKAKEWVMMKSRNLSGLTSKLLKE